MQNDEENIRNTDDNVIKSDSREETKEKSKNEQVLEQTSSVKSENFDMLQSSFSGVFKSKKNKAFAMIATAVAVLVVIGVMFTHGNSNEQTSNDESTFVPEISETSEIYAEDNVAEEFIVEEETVEEKEPTEPVIIDTSNQKVKTIFRKTFGDDYTSFSGYSNTVDGGLIVAGSSNSKKTNPTYGSYHNGLDGLVVKYKANGNVEYSMLIGGSRDDTFFDVVETSEGGFVAVGNISSSDGDFPEAPLCRSNDRRVSVAVKISPPGKIEWVNYLEEKSYLETSVSIVKNADGDFITVQNSGDDTVQYGNASISCIDNKTGETKWRSEVTFDEYNELNSLITLKSKEYLVAGHNRYGAIIQLYNDDTVVDEQLLIPEIEFKEVFAKFYDAIQTEDGNYIAVGVVGEDQTLIAKYDVKTEEWIYEIGEEDSGSFMNVIEVEDGYMIAGDTSDNRNIIIGKYTKDKLHMGMYTTTMPQNDNFEFVGEMGEFGDAFITIGVGDGFKGIIHKIEIEK